MKTDNSKEKKLILMFDGEQIHKFTVNKHKKLEELKLDFIDKMLKMDFSHTKSKYVSFISGDTLRLPTDKGKLEVLKEYLIDEIEFKKESVKKALDREALEQAALVQRMESGDDSPKMPEEESLLEKTFKNVSEFLDKYDGETPSETVMFQVGENTFNIPEDKEKLERLWYMLLLEKEKMNGDFQAIHGKIDGDELDNFMKKVKENEYKYNKSSFKEKCEKAKEVLKMCNEETTW